MHFDIHHGLRHSRQARNPITTINAVELTAHQNQSLPTHSGTEKPISQDATNGEADGLDRFTADLHAAEKERGLTQSNGVPSLHGNQTRSKPKICSSAMMTTAAATTAIAADVNRASHRSAY